MGTFSFDELTSTAFKPRSAEVHGDRTAAVVGVLRFDYRDYPRRFLALIALLAVRGVKSGDRVAELGTNGHVSLELRHGVPMRAAVLVPLNYLTFHLRATLDAKGLVGYPRRGFAGDTVPRRMHFADLPDTSTGTNLKAVLCIGRPNGVAQ